jgi:chromosome segregation ATPase
MSRERLDRYAEALLGTGAGSTLGGRRVALTVMAVADAEQAELRAAVEAASDRTSRLAGRLHDANNAARDLLAQMDALRAEIRDRESERADLRDRAQKAEAVLERVEALVDQWERVGGFLSASQLQRLRAALEDRS